MSQRFTPEEIEGRLTAQRRVLQWLLGHTIESREDFEALVASLDEEFPPPDHQEDPGAVPVAAFAIIAAATAETRLLLESVRMRWGEPNTTPDAGQSE